MFREQELFALLMAGALPLFSFVCIIGLFLLWLLVSLCFLKFKQILELDLETDLTGLFSILLLIFGDYMGRAAMDDFFSLNDFFYGFLVLDVAFDFGCFDM
jgi:hypothetical protein